MACVLVMLISACSMPGSCSASILSAMCRSVVFFFLCLEFSLDSSIVFGEQV